MNLILLLVKMVLEKKVSPVISLRINNLLKLGSFLYQCQPVCYSINLINDLVNLLGFFPALKGII